MLTISQGATAVLQVTLNNTTSGAYTVAQLAPINHPAGNDENNVEFTIKYVVKDGDNDTTTGSLKINVDDDVPVANSNVTTGIVDEDALPGGLEGGPGDIGVYGTIATGNVASVFSSGADVPLTYSLINSFGGLPILHSGGVLVTYAVASNVLTASAGPGNTVFTFELNSTTGEWTFTLVNEIDHTYGDNTETDLVLNLGSIVKATDNDGDGVVANSNAVQITIDDDSPVTLPPAANLIANGDFLSGGDFPVSYPWGANGHGGIDDAIASWTAATSNPGGASTVQFERVGDGYLGMFTSNGSPMIDMAASPGNIGISQNIAGLSAGQAFAIQFEAGAPFPSTASLEIVWNGVVVATIDPAGPMTSYNYVVIANGGSDELTFREVGVGNAALPAPNATEGYHGTYLANVALVATAFVDEDGLPTGNHDSQPGDNVVPDTDFDANEATATGVLGIQWGADNVNGGTDGADANTGFVQDGSGRAVYFTNANVTVSAQPTPLWMATCCRT